MDGDDLTIFVNAVAILCGERILVFVFIGELQVAVVLAHNVFSHVSQVCVVGVMLDQAFLGVLAVVH